MMTHEHIEPLLQDYLDGALDEARRRQVATHLDVCPSCHAAWERLHVVADDLAALPRQIAPSRDLWPEIEAQLASPPPSRRSLRADRAPQPKARRVEGRRRRWAVLGVLLLLVGVGAWMFAQRAGVGWEVAVLEGAPRVGDRLLDAAGRLRVGQWIETDDASRATLDVGAIGSVEVLPGSRVQLLAARATDHRLSLDEGSLHARIWAPPRLFFVETPSALAIDLGCEYTLKVNEEGESLLHVLSGFVELEHAGRASVVPEGALALARPGHGPGVPFAEDASDAFRRALPRYDFEGEAAALNVLLAEARPEDVISLFPLMRRADGAAKGRLFDRIAALTPLPDGVTREGALQNDPAMLEIWEEHLGLDANGWWPVFTSEAAPVRKIVFSPKQEKPWRIVIPGDDEPGESLYVTGQVFGPDGETPLPDVHLHVYHTDAAGLYAPPGTPDGTHRLRGDLWTNVEGRYAFRTIRPGAYPNTATPQHIHFVVEGDDFPEQRFDLFFADDLRVSDRMRAREKSKGRFAEIQPVKSADDGTQQVRFDLRLAR